MPAALSREEREQQIHTLCENTIYSFAGWDGEYKNLRSNILVRCEIHGINPVRTEEFLNSKQRRCKFCSASKERPARRTDEKIWLSKITLVNDEYTFSGWESERKDCNAKVRMLCEKHGEWVLDIQTAINGCTCPSCHHESRRKPVNELIEDLNRKLHFNNYSFVKFVDGYTNAKSRVLLSCVKHGEWESNPNRVLSGRGCPKCKGDKIKNHFSFTQDEATLKISNVLQNAGFRFVEWQFKYDGQRSKVICECPVHGQWVSSFTSLWNQKTGCPACGNYGFSSNLKGYLYCLRSQCGRKVKIGITNYPDKRIKQLQKRTPFLFDTIEILSFENGADARQWEKIFHETFASASLTGFDGCTEWLVWTPEIQGWFRFLK